MSMFFTSRNRKLSANVNRLEELEKNIKHLNQENKEYLEVIENREKVFNRLVEEKSMAFPWLTEAMAEFHHYQDVEIADYLERKKHPAYRKAEEVREIAAEKKVLRKKAKMAENFVKYYESLFPWITDYVGESLNELLESVSVKKNLVESGDDEQDPVLQFMPLAEFQKLSTTERNQKALDRYLSSRKAAHEIGRDYERFIGHSFEMQGYEVQYVGIEQGLEDMGRDLICTKDGQVEIIQCKCWAAHKTIHEKHINQLYGTMVKYCIDNKNKFSTDGRVPDFHELLKSGRIVGIFVTSTKLSQTAKEFAAALGIEIIESRVLQKYPMIKCNINSKGERIYHLPFDQQYDKTRIKLKGEFYAETVTEAESKGFRRAFKWRGN